MFKRSYLVLAALLPAPAFAAFTPPSFVTAPTPADLLLTPIRTYQQWDKFTSVTGPNAADVYDVNPNGNANAFDSNAALSGSFPTGGGNIYSFSGTIKPRVVVPLPPADGFAEAVKVEITVLGTALDGANAVVNGVAAGSLPGYSLDVTAAGSGMGGSFTYVYNFRTPDTTSLTFDVSSTGASTSLDLVAVTTQSTIPEPAALAALGVGGLALLRRRR